MNEFQGFALFPRMRARWIVCAWWEDSAIPWEVTAHGERGQMPWWTSRTQAPQTWLWEHDVCAGRCRRLSGLGETSSTERGVSLSGCMQVKHHGGNEHHFIYNWLAIPYSSPSPLYAAIQLVIWTIVSIIYSLIISITQCITCCAYRSSQYKSLFA